MKPRYRLAPGRHNSYALLFVDIDYPFVSYLVPRHIWSTWSMGVWT